MSTNYPRRRWINWLKRPGNKERLMKLYQRQEGRCVYCLRHVPYYPGKQMVYSIDGNHATFDHQVPLSKGGNLGMTNLVMACWECNQERNREDMEYELYKKRLEDNAYMDSLIEAGE